MEGQRAAAFADGLMTYPAYRNPCDEQSQLWLAWETGWWTRWYGDQPRRTSGRGVPLKLTPFEVAVGLWLWDGGASVNRLGYYLGVTGETLRGRRREAQRAAGRATKCLPAP